MSRRLLGLCAFTCLAVGVWACSGEPENSGNMPSGTAGTSSAGTSASSAGTGVGVGGSAVGTAGTASGGAPATGGTAPSTGGTAATTGGVVGTAGTSTAGTGTGGSNPGNYPDPPRPINVTRTDKISIGFAPSAADPQASGSQHYGEFDGSKPLQKKLVLPFGGVNSDPWRMGWAVDRGYHVLTVDLWNDYPKDPGYPEYLESWSGEDKSATLTQSPANGVMARVKAGLKYLSTQDPGSDWGYYLDAAGEVRWNDVIVFGYSFGGQMGVAASKYIAADRIIITSAPNVPIDSPWLKLPAKTAGERCFFLGGNKDGEHPTHKAETELLGWPGEVINFTKLKAPFPATNRIEVDDGHSSFCGRPFNDGMVDWDSICEFMFNTKK
jgi:hypothetical protein